MPYSVKKLLLASLCSISLSTSVNAQDLISLFPIEHYTYSPIINPNDSTNDNRIISTTIQYQHFNLFKDHYIGNQSPWNEHYIKMLFSKSSPDDIRSIELRLIEKYSNKNKATNSPKLGYGENFRPHDNAWIDNIATNMNLDALSHLSYSAQNRAIAIDNTPIRSLPTDEVHFYSYKLAGQGYPFDNIQDSILLAGTPVYIVQESRDHAWSLIITPEVVDWVKSNRLARVDNAFIKAWGKAAEKTLVSVLKPNTSITDSQNHFLFYAQPAAVFPAAKISDDQTVTKIYVPVADADGQAIMKIASLNLNNKDEAVLMPLPATIKNFNQVISYLIGRPYGWGNLYGYNDCSAETKSIFTPFGIWLPRNSKDQTTAGKLVDMTNLSPAERLAYLQKNGRAYATLIYIGGHIMLYVGNDGGSNHTMAMTYQNMWGLRPHQGEGRAVVGMATFFPLLLQYPEDPNLASQLEGQFFELIYLDEPPPAEATISLYNMMIPETMSQN